MTREYKFRAWDGKKMHYDVVPWQWDFVISRAWHKCEKSTGSGILGSGGDTAEMLVPAIRFKSLMLSLEMPDITGQNIYENDIITYDLAAGLGEPERQDLKKVVVMSPYGVFSRWHKNIRVIGNIHQNPEMWLNPIKPSDQEICWECTGSGWMPDCPCKICMGTGHIDKSAKIPGI
jgi:hypothetical protein